MVMALGDLGWVALCFSLGLDGVGRCYRYRKNCWVRDEVVLSLVAFF